MRAMTKVFANGRSTKMAELERLEKQTPIPKQTTLDARKADIEALARTRDGLENHRRKDSGAYMFGILVCLTGKKFAAVSGNEVPPRFKAIAENHGCKVIEEAATLMDFMAINPSCAAGDAAAISVLYRGPAEYAPKPVAEVVKEGPWTPPSIDDIKDGKGGERVEVRRKMRRKKEVTVLSCQSCQDTLFMARCDIEKQSCQ